MSDVGRQPKGVPVGGQFTVGPRTEPQVSLTTQFNGQPWELELSTGVDPALAGLPAVRPADWDPFGVGTDRLVASVQNGPMAQGHAEIAHVQTMTSWHRWAQEQSKVHALDDPDLADACDEFARGMEHAVVALMSDKGEVAPEYVVAQLQWVMGSHVRVGNYAQARRILPSKRTSKGSRAEWARAAGEATSNPAWRGYLTAAAALSGVDEWWGLRDDPDATVGRV